MSWNKRQARLRKRRGNRERRRLSRMGYFWVRLQTFVAKREVGAAMSLLDGSVGQVFSIGEADWVLMKQGRP